MKMLQWVPLAFFAVKPDIVVGSACCEIKIFSKHMHKKLSPGRHRAFETTKHSDYDNTSAFVLWTKLGSALDVNLLPWRCI